MKNYSLRIIVLFAMFILACPIQVRAASNEYTQPYTYLWLRKNVKDYLDANNVSVVVMSRYDLTQKAKEVPFDTAGEPETVIGFTEFNDDGSKTIYLANSTKEKVFLHELGHAIENEEIIKQFRPIYREEKTWLKDDKYHQSTVYEYFAESVRCYMSTRETLRQNAPKTYDFVKKYIESL